ALPYVMREIPEAHLLILGSGPYERDLYELARHLGVYDRVSIRHVAPAERQGMATVLAGSSVAVARELVTAMSSPSLVDGAQLPSWDSCAEQLAHVYLSSAGIAAASRAPRTRDAVGRPDRDGLGR